MTGAEIAGLKWLADFMTSVLSAAAGDRLKPRPSTVKARDRGYALFEALAKLRVESATFVQALHGVADLANRARLGEARADVRERFSEWNRDFLEPIEPEIKNLDTALKSVVEALNYVADCLRDVNPQLEIAMPDVAEAVLYAGRSRAMMVSRAERALHHLAQGAVEGADLSPMVVEAERAQRAIEDATEAFRGFLAAEIAFKDSF